MWSCAVVRGQCGSGRAWFDRRTLYLVYLVVVSLTNATLDGPGYDAAQGGGPGCQLACLRFHSRNPEAVPGNRGGNTKMAEN